MSSFNQGVPGPATLINSSNCIVLGNTSSGTALTVQQLGAGAVMNVATSTGSSALFVSSTGQVGVGTNSQFGNGFGSGLMVNSGTINGSNAFNMVLLSNATTVNYTQVGQIGFGIGGDMPSFSIQSQAVNRDNGAGPYYDYGAQSDLRFLYKSVNIWPYGGVNEAMRIKGTNGYVGIGVTNPGYPLDVLSSSTTSLFRIQSSNDPATMVISTYSDTTKDCAIRNNNGQLGFTASSTPGTPYIKFFTGASGAFTNLLGGFSSTLTGGATTLSVDASGYIIRTPSDERLKTDVQPISYGLDTVNSFRPVSYNWNEPEKYGSGRSIGLIAQEVGELVPEAVSAGGDEDKILSLDYQKLVPVLTKAIQELSQENTTLKQSLETATAQLQSIEQRLAAAGL